MKQEESRYDRGLASMRAMFGPGIESALKGLAASSPDLARYAGFPAALEAVKTAASVFGEKQ